LRFVYAYAIFAIIVTAVAYALFMGLIVRPLSALTSPLSGYMPAGQDIWLLEVMAAVFLASLAVVVFRGKGVRPFISPAYIVTTRIVFFIAAIITFAFWSFLSVQATMSYGNGPSEKARNHYRLTRDYRDLIMKLPLGLSAQEKGVIGGSLTEHPVQEPPTTKKTAKTRQKKGSARGSIVSLTPAAAAYMVATVKTLNLILLVGIFATVFMVSRGKRLLWLGHVLWVGFTDGTQNAILKILCRLGYIPMVFLFGFVWSPMKMPSFHGTPGGFARIKTIAGLLVACVLFALAAVILMKASPSLKIDQAAWSLAVTILVLGAIGVGVVSLGSAGRAWDSYWPERETARGLMFSYANRKHSEAMNSVPVKIDVYWGFKHPQTSVTRDMTSRVLSLVRGIFTRAKKPEQDIDLAIRYPSPGGSVG